MKRLFLITITLITFASLSQAQDDKELLPPEATEFYTPTIRKIDPGNATTAPSDAIVLFNGNDLSAWEGQKGSRPKWKVEGDHFTVEPKTGGITTKQSFGDMQLHIEWRSPQEVKGEGQGRGNSGVFLMGRYEVQVLDSYESKTYVNGQAGSIYKQSPPLVNAMKPVDQWEVYDIIWKAPRFNKDGALVSPAYVTVLHNGIVVQNHFQLMGPTEYRGIPYYKAHEDKLPISLQDHGNPVSYRNIWVREL
ncbi:DUF1080 domain-containing protein [Flammeovirgaceae bacterium SG7u.111]|nr:DUF1080 domain-containing protein [Flammeovirgaceae bacterium SG7u.132]WPO36805.1 DUF1080 domain-containing protein [Flammeovirgaceae bacterium SG7u.111]